MNKKIRVRFAPSPTGYMHLGNIRSSLINYLFARQKGGTFILRIEDTDVRRNIEAVTSKIIEDLQWLGLEYDEGPKKGGSYGPYFQSQRGEIYTRYLNELIDKNLVYRCFCTTEELEKKRKRQLTLKQPPKYDRACTKLTKNEIENRLSLKVPFIWRFRLDDNKTVSFYDMAHKQMTFELKHFSDIPLTRQDGTFTFMFANFIDDHEMKISHVFRGEDHLSNTAAQIALYESFNAEIPVFWHLPIIGNKEGKKLSKRDFGFSLSDLKNEGFLAESITNYLAILGSTFQKELMSMNEIINSMDFENISTTGIIKYDIEKLKWINHKKIMHLDTDKLAELCRPFLASIYSEVKKMPVEKLAALIKPVQAELITLKQSVETLEFYFKKPFLSKEVLESYGFVMYEPFFHHLVAVIKDYVLEPEKAVEKIKLDSKKHNIPLSDTFKIIRIALTGKAIGPSILDLIRILGPEESLKRISNLLVITIQ